LSHYKISILGCENIFEYDYPSVVYFENFPKFSGIIPTLAITTLLRGESCLKFGEDVAEF